MMQWHRISGFALLLLTILAVGCSSSRQASFNPQRKYAPQKLQQDYMLFRNVLQQSHPSLYWFTPKDSMDYYFDEGYGKLKDSMTEMEFKNLLAYVAAKVRCGHTSVRYSKKYSHYLDTARLPIFPLSFKVWSDSLVVTANLNRRDSVLKRGTVVTGIDNYTARELVDTLGDYLSGDGNAMNGKYQAMSNRGVFGSLYRNILGAQDTFHVHYVDSMGIAKVVAVPVSKPVPVVRDTTRRATTTGPQPQPPQPPVERRSMMLNGARNVQIDTTLSSAYMTVNTFARNNGLRSFFRKAFKQINKYHIKSLVIDVRGNGGGDAGLSTLLTKYVADKKFKLADSLYTIKRSSSYASHIQLQRLYWLFTLFVTHKESDGKYHFGYFERHYFKPRKKNHFDGDVYILIGGNSFSATTLFVRALKGQQNVKVIGEETGGGAYGNTAWLIPDVKLPNTGIRFRLPRFRLVMDADAVKEGRGIAPDIEAAPNAELIKKGLDPKVELVREMIFRKTFSAHH
ncbi:MAG: S41 family peptidase [Chitinophagaceae bacterium]